MSDKMPDLRGMVTDDPRSSHAMTMKPNRVKLSLHIPGLLAAPARLLAQLALPAAPALREWCARARDEPVASGRYGLHAELLDVPPPIAALSWLGETGTLPPHPVLLATPVHFQAGMSDLVLFRTHAQGAELERLATDIATFFGREPVLRVANGTWFIELPHRFAVRTAPVHVVQGQMVRACLPEGSDAPRVNRWMNELQMFLHNHAVNRERAKRGAPALNGVWLWGEGELPPVDRDGLVVYSHSAVTRGIGRLRGEAHEMRALADMLPPQGHHVIEFEDCVRALDADDVVRWQQAVSDIDARVLRPVLGWLSSNRRAEAVLYAGDGVARRVRPAAAWLARLRAFACRDRVQLVEE